MRKKLFFRSRFDFLIIDLYFRNSRVTDSAFINRYESVVRLDQAAGGFFSRLRKRRFESPKRLRGKKRANGIFEFFGDVWLLIENKKRESIRDMSGVFLFSFMARFLTQAVIFTDAINVMAGNATVPNADDAPSFV